jgi:transketolase
VLQRITDAAADTLQAEGLSASVVSMHTLCPLDEAAVRRAIHESSLIVTLEEHNMPGPLANGIARVVAASPRNRDSVAPLFFGASPGHACGSREYLHAINGLSAEKITASILKAVKCPAPLSQ